MFEHVLDEETENTIKILSSHEIIGAFYLAGGTACAIHMGHRTSNDLDFFSKEEFSHFKIRDFLKGGGDFIVDYSDARTLIGRFNHTKLSFFNYNYPLIKELYTFLNMRISSLEDIGCMKIDAISSRGSKRDFVDLFFILKTLGTNLTSFFTLFEEKYGAENYNHIHILKSLVYFDDAESDPELNMLSPCSWKDVKTFFERQVKEFKSF